MPTARTRPSEPSTDRPNDAAATAAPALRGLVRLSLLERVSPELLVRFLRPFQGYLAVRGVELDGITHDLPWVGRLHTVLTAVDPQMPGPLQQALLDVADLASEQGHEIAIVRADAPAR